MPDNRQQRLQEWLSDNLATSFEIEVASSDASFRRYFRIQQAETTYIAMDAPPEYEDTTPFIDISERLLATGVNAPKIFFKNTAEGFLLLSDLGTQDYLSRLNTDTADTLYIDAMQSIIKMQQQANTQGLPGYNTTLLETEMNLFDEWFLQQHLQITLSDAQQDLWQQTKQLLINNAIEQPQAFVHRDYHSRNLMLTEQNNPGIIDFQDAVIGPISYDLVSMLRDCYIRWPDEKVYQWVEEFYTMLNSDYSLNTFIRWFDLMGLQRHIKVLGIFARLNHRDNKPAYLKDLPLTYAYTDLITRKYPELSGFKQLLDELEIKTRIQDSTK